MATLEIRREGPTVWEESTVGEGLSSLFVKSVHLQEGPWPH